MSRKLTIEVSDETFATLEVVAFGLELENNGDVDRDWKGHDKKRDDFGPAVRELLTSVAGSLATGADRPGSWERGVLESLTGWQGTYNPGMVADCVKDIYPSTKTED